MLADQSPLWLWLILQEVQGAGKWHSYTKRRLWQTITIYQTENKSHYSESFVGDYRKQEAAVLDHARYL